VGLFPSAIHSPLVLNKVKKPFIIAILLFILGGCSTTSSNNKSILSPSTWFSDRPLIKLEDNEEKLEDKKKLALEKVQDANLEAKLSLSAGTQPRNIEVALHSLNTGYLLLNQVVGPISTERFEKIQKYVLELLSDNAKVLKNALEERDARDKNINKLSTSIDELTQKNAELTGKLKDGFERENALANSHRALWSKIYIVIGIFVILFVLHNVLPLLANIFPFLLPISGAVSNVISPGLSYVARRGRKGLESIGELLADNPDKPEIVEALDKYLDKDQQRIVRNNKIRLVNKRRV